MGFQGQLSSVNLTDIFQTLNMNRQTGTLAVSGPVTSVHIYFDQGQIAMCSAPVVNNRPYLLDAMVHKGQLAAEKADELSQQLRASNQPLRDLVLSSGAVADYELDEMSAWCIEELVCPVFEWQEGDFTFIDGAPVQELTSLDVVAMGNAMVQTTQLVMEATRRMDEWKRIREVITDPDALYIVDNDGRANLKNVQTDPEMLKVLRYLDGRHSLNAIAMSVGVTRFDTFAIVAQLVLAGVARPKTAQEVVDDAVSLMQQGDMQQAKELLDNAIRQAPIPEVMRPLAECCVKLNQAPRAVELYLELIQMAQDQGDLPNALADLDTVINLSPDDPDLHFERGQIQAELGQVEPAAASYATAAQTYLARKDLPRAIDACHRAKNLLPRSPEPHRYLARAYLLEGQTENAVVEYKSLWHALLTGERPKKALDTLRAILDADCKYNNVKDQVLGHAQNSEAIKTSKAARILVYVAIVALAATAMVFGWEYYHGHVIKQYGESKVNDFEATLTSGMQSGRHLQLLEELDDLKTKYGTNSEVSRRLEERRTQIEKDFEARAGLEFQRADAAREAGKYEEAEAIIGEMKVKYQNTQSASNADTILEAIHFERIKSQVSTKMKEAESLWNNLNWDGAIAILQTILDRKDLPASLREDYTRSMAEWSDASKSAQKLYERAQRYEQNGSKHEVLTAFRRAATGQGEQWADKARARVLSIELEMAHDLGKLAADAANRGDDQATFTQVDELATLAKEASGRTVGDYYATLELPFTLQMDSNRVQLSIKRPGAEESRVSAPAGKRGSWSERITYRVNESVTVEASRPGFSPQKFSIDVKGRKTQAVVSLSRGWRWRTDLSGASATRPIVAQKLVLLGTDKGTLEMIDPVLGANREVKFPNNIAEFTVAPFVYQDRAYAVLDDHVFAVDLNSRVRLWQWPQSLNAQDRLNGHLWVQEHEIKPGQLLVFAATIKAGLQIIEVDPTGATRAYPKLASDADITGAPFVDHPAGMSILYVPAGTSLIAYDISEITELSPPRKLYTLQSRGDLIGKLVKAKVADRDSLMVSDMSGVVMAFDCDRNVPDSKRVVAAWPIDGTSPSTPVLLPGQPVAFVSVAEGRIVAIDLAHPGQLLWRFPAQGSLGTLPGSPAIGAHGVYIADGKGLLHCLDPLTGSERWKADVGGAAVGGVLAYDGRVFVPTKAGQLVCFEEGDE